MPGSVLNAGDTKIIKIQSLSSINGQYSGEGR